MTKYGWRDNSVTTKKLKVDGKMPVQYVIPKFIAAGTNVILNSFDVNAVGTATIDNTDFALQPPYAAQLSIQAGSAGTAGNGDTLLIEGYNAKGQIVKDTVIVRPNAGSTEYTSNAYAKITSIIPNQTHKSTAVNVGIREYIGLPYPIEQASDILTYTIDDKYATTDAPIGSVFPVYDTIKVPSMDAASSLNIVWMSKVQE